MAPPATTLRMRRSSVPGRMSGASEVVMGRRGGVPSSIDGNGSLAGFVSSSWQSGPTASPLVRRVKLLLLVALELERDFELGPIGLHLSVLDLHIEFRHLGDTQIAECLAGARDGRRGGLL